MTTISLPARGGVRNGAAAAAWVRSQTYNVAQAASDPTTSPAVLLDIAQNGTSALVARVAANRALTQTIADAIMAAPANDTIQQRLSTNPSTSTLTLSQLLTWVEGPSSLPGNHRLWAKLISHKNMDPALLVARIPTTPSPSAWEDKPALPLFLAPANPILEVARALKRLAAPDHKLLVVQKRRLEFQKLLSGTYRVSVTGLSDAALGSLIETTVI